MKNISIWMNEWTNERTNKKGKTYNIWLYSNVVKFQIVLVAKFYLFIHLNDLEISLFVFFHLAFFRLHDKIIIDFFLCSVWQNTFIKNCPSLSLWCPL